MARLNEAELEAQLKGKTLQIYWFMLRGGGRGFGVREIQRALNLSSPSLAAHHLEKLKSLGLVEKTPTGEYVVSKEVKVGFLKFFFRFGRLRLPRLMFYAAFVTAMLAAYVMLYPQNLSLHNLMALIFGSASAAILWYEALKTLREAPF